MPTTTRLFEIKTYKVSLISRLVFSIMNARHLLILLFILFSSVCNLNSINAQTSADFDISTGASGSTAGTDNSTVKQYTWNVPAGVSSIMVEVWGSGGGGSRSNSDGDNGGGGSGGVYARKYFYAVSAGTTLYIQVGKGGAGGTSTNQNGSNGNPSWVRITSQSGTVIASANGGNGAVQNSTSATGGAQAITYSIIATSPTTNDAYWYGGAGGGGNGSFGRGGGGGGGAGSGADGASGTANTSSPAPGGAGGAALSTPFTGLSGGTGGSCSSSSSSGGAGNVRGGGGAGGGGNAANNGGAGGGGFVRITYTATPAPTVTSFSPSSVCASNSETVTITGTNFTGATAVSIGGTAASSFTVNSSTQITATIGAGTTGTISVTTAGGTAASSSSLTVNANRTVGAASSSQTVCSNYAITNITHATTGVTGISSSSGLPAGVTAAYASNTITLSGTPTQSGTYPYTITPNGCGSATATGTITVNDPPSAVSSAISPDPFCAGATLTLNGTSTNATTWSWTGPNSYTASTEDASITSAISAAAGIYYLTASNTCGDGGIVDAFGDNNYSTNPKWTVQSGAFDQTSNTLIGEATATEDRITIPSTQVYGSWQFSFNFQTTASTSSQKVRYFTHASSTSLTTTNGYYIYLDASGVIRLNKMVAGVATILISGTFTANTSSHTIKLTRRVNGDFELFYDAVSKGTANDLTYTSSVYSGVWNTGAIASDNHTVDNISCSSYVDDEVTLGSSLAGTVTVGSSGANYPSLTGTGGLFEAINNCGLSNNLTVSITSDLTEDGTNALNQWSGSYTLSMVPSSSVLKTISGTVSNAMIRFNGADNVTIDGAFSGSGKYLKFKNIDQDYAVVSYANAAVNNTFKNCYVELGFNGINLADLNCTNNVITSNDIFDFDNLGVYISSASSTVSSNTIYSTTSKSAGVAGIGIIDGDNTIVEKNSIYNLSPFASSNATGIYYFGTNASTMTVIARNNMINLGSNTSTTGDLEGILYEGYNANSFLVYNNTIRISGNVISGAPSYGLAKVRGAKNIEFKNNLVYNERSSSNTYQYALYYSNNNATSFVSNYNDLFVGTGTLSYFAHGNGSNIYNSLSSWQVASSKDINSINIQPNFVSSTDLHLTSSNCTIDRSGVSLNDVTNDYDSQSRSTSPDIGADEFDPYTISLVTSANPTTCSGLNGSIQLSGLASSTSYTYTYYKNGVLISSAGTSTASGGITISGLTAGTYTNITFLTSSCYSNTLSGPITLSDPSVPSSVSVSGGTTQCGGSVTLTASGGSGGTIYWQNTTSGGTSTATASSSQSVSSSGTYYFRSYNSTTGCWGAEGSASVTINSAPSSVSVSGGTTQCGGSVTLTASGGSGGTIYWQNTTSGGTSTATASSSESVSSSGTYYFRSYNSTTGCWGAEGSASVTINSVPAQPSATNCWDNYVFNTTSCSWVNQGSSLNQPIASIATPSSTVLTCTTTSITLNSSGGGTYNWSKNGVGIGSTASLVVTQPGLYTVLVSNSSGCTDTESITITQNIAPPSVVINSASSTTFCEGGQVLLSVPTSPNASYQWYRNGLPLNGANASSYSATIAGSYTIQVINSGGNGCSATSAPVTVVVNPVPAVYAGADVNVCAGGTVTLTATGASTYSWTNNVLNGIAFIPSNSANYIVTGTNSFGCTKKDTVYVNVINLPSIPIISTNSPICAGNNAVFTLTGNANETVVYKINGSALQSIQLTNGTASITVSNAQFNQTLTITSVQNLGCNSNSNTSAQIIVNPAPTASISSSGGSICYGQNAQFTISGTSGSTASYRINGGVVQTVILVNGSAIITIPNATSNQTLNLVSVATSQCSQNLNYSLTVVVKSLPVATVSSTVAQICSGQTAQFTISGTTGSTVEYQVNGGSVQNVQMSNGTMPINITNSTTNQQVTLISITNPTTGCTNSLSSSALVTVIPSPSINVVNPSSVCIGNSSQFEVSGLQGTTLTYAINGATVVSGSIPSSGVLILPVNSVNSNQTLTVYSISNNGCSVVQNLAYTILALNPPFAQFSTSPVEVCYGSSASVSVVGTAGANVSYSINGQSNQQTIPSSGVTSISTPVLYSNTTILLQQVSNQGCVTNLNGTKLVTVREELSASVIAMDSTICLGGIANFEFSGQQGATINYTINGLLQDITLTNSSELSNYNVDSNLIVELVSVTDGICSQVISGQSVVYAVQPSNPDVVLSVIGSDSTNTVCAGTELIFVANSSNGGAFAGYEWFVNGTLISGQNDASYTTSSLSGQSIVYAIMYSSMQCITTLSDTSNNITVFVQEPLPVTVDLEVTDSVICNGEMVVFDAIGQNTGATPSYEWYLNNTLLANVGSQWMTNQLSEGDSVQVVLFSSEQCSNQTMNESNVVTMEVTTIQATVVHTKPGALKAYPDGMSYQWLDCTTGQLVVGAIQQVFKPSNGHTYAAIVSKNGCSDTSDCKAALNSVLGMEETTIEAIAVYPNPTNGKVTIYAPLNVGEMIQLLSTEGRVIAEFKLTEETYLLDIGNHSDGIYLVRIGERVIPVVKQ